MDDAFDSAFEAPFEDNDQTFNEDAASSAMDRLFEEIDAAEEPLGEDFLLQRMTACLRAVRVSMVRNADEVSKSIQELVSKWNVEEEQARNAYASTLLANCNSNISDENVKSIVNGKLLSQATFNEFFRPSSNPYTLTKRQNERLSKVVQAEEEEGFTYGREALSAVPLGLFGSSWSGPIKTLWILVTFATIFGAGFFGLKHMQNLEKVNVEPVNKTNRKERRYQDKQKKFTQ